MPRLADRQADRRQRRIGRNVGEPLAQPLERVGLQARQAGIQDDGGRTEAESIRDRQCRRRVVARAGPTRGCGRPRMTGATAPLAPAARPSWWWRGAAWAATSAGVVVLAYVIAHWGWHWFLPHAPIAMTKRGAGALGAGHPRLADVRAPPRPQPRQRPPRASPRRCRATPDCSAFSPAATARATPCSASPRGGRCSCGRARKSPAT